LRFILITLQSQSHFLPVSFALLFSDEIDSFISEKQDEKGAKRPAKKLDDTERLFANIRNLLNKLTLENFDELSRKIIELFNTINKPEILTDAVTILHSKVKNQSLSHTHTQIVQHNNNNNDDDDVVVVVVFVIIIIIIIVIVSLFFEIGLTPLFESLFVFFCFRR
jgi:hypothetical protein